MCRWQLVLVVIFVVLMLFAFIVHVMMLMSMSIAVDEVTLVIVHSLGNVECLISIVEILCGI